MYRPFFADASSYPPNQFLDHPRTDAQSLEPVTQMTLRNLAARGIVE